MRTILITGSTDGLGRWVALRLATDATDPARVIVHGRSAERAEEVREEIRRAAGEDRADVLLADLSVLKNVDALADEVLRRYDRLDVLVNNAGRAGTWDSPRAVTPDGYEERFAVNYLAGFHLTNRLLPLLKKSAPARIVNVASVGQEPIDFDDPMIERNFSPVRSYSQSKLAQILHAFDLAEDLRASGEDVTVNALHPASFMDTTMCRELGVPPWTSVDTGGRALLHLINDAHVGTGRYFDSEVPARADEQAYDPEARNRLRVLSEELVARALA
ncbi:SDR family NAD(P)-dependent oxidoreductase [Streptomyces hoynatensis]|uniref:SDR family NAD(P)-dependent oxidoreductase n=1 Tax=Streptomyces hoynatensis TaxID=1141874 RepID=A0A3A9Z0E4_9ACTN|nr:SDR family NAD(P)-dependent oxidoreductase [Streptomyces hoynatensis]RKN41763.1 SDR family NAD(P)-dependent oxidoreductase [Streptomyces hoynatensis]